MDPYIFVAVLAVTYLGWTAIHELSHLLMAQLLVGVEKILSFKIWPHKDSVHGWRWGGVSFTHSEEITDSQQVAIKMAPRIPELVSIMLIPLASGYALVFILGGMVGMVTAMFSISKSSDTVVTIESLRGKKSKEWLVRAILGLFVGVGLLLIVAEHGQKL